MEERLLGTVVDLKRGVIGSYLVGSINTFYKVIVYINKFRRKRTLHLYVVTAMNLGLQSSDSEPTQRRRTACDITSWWWLRALWAVVKSFYMG